MAKTDSRATRREAPLLDTAGRRLLAMTVFASLVLGGLLTFDLLPAGPTGYGGRVPVVGDIADRSYKASADLTVVDEAATEAERRKVMEQSPAVYDYAEGSVGEVRERVGRAFAAGRAALGGPADEAGPSPASAFQQALGEADADVPDAVAALLAGRFSADDEELLAGLLRPLAGRMVVADPDELGRQAEKRRIVVRELSSGRDRLLAEKPDVLTLASARAVVRQVAEGAHSGVPGERHAALAALAERLVRPNLSFNLRATEERRKQAAESVKDVTIRLRRGEIIVRDGDPVTERHVLLLRGLTQGGARDLLGRFAGLTALLLILLVASWQFAGSGLQRVPREPKDAAFLLVMLIGLAAGTKLALFIAEAVAANPEFVNLIGNAPVKLHFVVPVAAAAMLVRLVHSGETTAVFAVVGALVSALQVDAGVEYACFVLVGSLVAAVGAQRVSQRGTLLRAGARVGAANALVVAAIALLDPTTALFPGLLAVLAGFVSGCLAGGLVTALAPLVEGVFGYTTDVKLLELANREQPLLRELEVHAPGTYHHCMMVGHLAEKAAEAIGANPLLAKVAGYYHDIGKMRRPHFFVENITVHQGENRHEKLSPSMSARIIQAHVKDGLELGRQYKLVSPIMRGIAEHHGTSVIRFFYEKAKELVDPEKGDTVHEHEYRYPGPRPQTREAGILMLADSVEAASRTLAEPSPARIQQLVQRIINNYFRDGQLDDCSLTLRDLHAIARSLIDTLSAIRHERIDYPEPTDQEGKKAEGAHEGVVERLEPRKKDRPERAPKDGDDDLKRLGLS